MNQTDKLRKEANRIIDAMGGTVAVADTFKITSGAVSQWRDDGIPESRLFSIKLLRPDLFEIKKIKKAA